MNGPIVLSAAIALLAVGMILAWGLPVWKEERALSVEPMRPDGLQQGIEEYAAAYERQIAHERQVAEALRLAEDGAR